MSEQSIPASFGSKHYACLRADHGMQLLRMREGSSPYPSDADSGFRISPRGYPLLSGTESIRPDDDSCFTRQDIESNLLNASRAGVDPKDVYLSRVIPAGPPREFKKVGTQANMFGEFLYIFSAASDQRVSHDERETQVSQAVSQDDPGSSTAPVPVQPNQLRETNGSAEASDRSGQEASEPEHVVTGRGNTFSSKHFCCLDFHNGNIEVAHIQDDPQGSFIPFCRVRTFCVGVDGVPLLRPEYKIGATNESYFTRAGANRNRAAAAAANINADEAVLTSVVLPENMHIGEFYRQGMSGRAYPNLEYRFSVPSSPGGH